MSSFVKNGLTLIGLILVAGLGYYLFVINNNSSLTGDSLVNMNEAQLLNDQFVRQLNDIKSFTLSDELFLDQRFRSFVDFTTPISPRPIGRDNPFEPVR